MLSFNLIDEPWIPVTAVNGRRSEVSLRELFDSAHELRAVDDDSPLTFAALHRILLAIVHAAVKGPKKTEDWLGLWERRVFADGPIPHYLHEWRDRFDLFSKDAPFYQVAGYEIAEPYPITKLLPEAASGDNKTLFDHRSDAAVEGLSPAAAARAVITAQAFVIGAGKCQPSNVFREEKPYSANSPLIGGAVVLLSGRTLFETLMLNLVIYVQDRPIPNTDHDLPVWERTSFEPPGERTPDGYLDYLTWTSRYLRLVPASGVGGVVGQVHFGQGHRVPAGALTEPMFAYRIVADTKSSNAGGDRRFPIGVSPDRALWRDSDALLLIRQSPNLIGPAALRQANGDRIRDALSDSEELTCRILGLANNKANPLLWRHEQLPVPTALLRDESLASVVQSAVEYGESGARCLMRAGETLAMNLLPPASPRETQRALISALGLMEAYWGALELRFRAFLRGLATDPDEAYRAWVSDVRAAAYRSLRERSDNAAGRSAREFRARVEADRQLGTALASINPEESKA